MALSLGRKAKTSGRDSKYFGTTKKGGLHVHVGASACGTARGESDEEATTHWGRPLPTAYWILRRHAPRTV